MDRSIPTASPVRRGRPPKGESDHAERLVRAAREEFLRVGYASATMDAIISHAQMSKRTAYAFGNKSALLEAVISAHTRDQFTPIEALDAEAMPAKAFLLAIGEAFLNAACDPMTQQIDHLLMGEAKTFPQLADRFHSDGLGRAKALVRTSFEKLGVVDVDIACDAFYALLVLQPLRAPAMVEAKRIQYVQDVVDFLLR